MFDEASLAREIATLYPAVYLRLHTRRPSGRKRLTEQTLAVLHHLAWAGPLTIGEMARHLERAQSVISEIVDRLEADGWLERMRDSRDRRRSLVWLTSAGQEVLRQAASVLSEERLERALRRMRPAERRKLLDGLRALVRAADESNSKEGRRP